MDQAIVIARLRQRIEMQDRLAREATLALALREELRRARASVKAR